MDGFRFDDLKRGVQIGVYFSPVYLAFSEATDDIEVAFKSEDGQALVAVLERSLASQKHGDSASTDEPLVHRFKNIDGDEDAAFIVRKSPQGLDLTLVSGLEEVDDLSGSDTGGMSVYISSGDARELTDALSNTLKSLAGGPDLSK
jgi:hypothetical protein